MIHKKWSLEKSRLHQQGMRESNSHQKFWRLLSYHLTNPLYIIVLFQTINIITYLIHFCKCTFKTSYKVQESNVFESRSSRFRYASSRWFCYAKPSLYQVPYPQANLLHATSYILPSFSAFGQALDRLVTVSSMCCHTSTSALSTL